MFAAAEFSDTREANVKIQELIDNAQKLPNVPKVVQELIESFGNENVNNDEVNLDKIIKDNKRQQFW